MEWLSTRVRFLREMQNSWPVRLLWWGWAVLSALSTTSLILPQIRSVVPPWPWYVWLIGLLALSLVAVFEGGFREVQKLRGVYDPLNLSRGLSGLPVYGQELEIEVRCIQRGVSYLDFSGETVFLEASVFSPIDMAFRGIKIRLSVAGDAHESDAITDLSDWLLQKELSFGQYAFTDMNTLSLWKDLRENGLKAGLHKAGWLAMRLPDVCHDIANRSARIKISIDRVGSSELYRFAFCDLKAGKETILSKQMKEYRLGS